MAISNGCAGMLCVRPLVIGMALLAAMTFAGNLHAGVDEGVDIPEAWVDARTHEAMRLIDRWSGEGEDGLAQARGLLDEALLEDPDSAPALVQYARLVLRTGVASDGGQVDDVRQAAIVLIDQALASDPAYSRAYVLLGHVRRGMSDYVAARAALEKAGELGSNDPWFESNWADLRYDEGSRDEAIAYWKRVTASGDGNRNVRVNAHQRLIDYYSEAGYSDEGSSEESDASYRAIIEEVPAAAWPRSRYANFRLCRLGDFEGAQRHAEAAIAIRDDLPSQLALSAALYRKWSSQVLDQNGRGEEQTWMAATGVLPVDPVAVLGMVCTGDGIQRPVLRALQLTGRGDAIPPMLGVLLAAEHEDKGVMGLFALQVKNIGSSGGHLYLGSETDYRDQRNLAIRILPDPLAELLRSHGGDPESLFMGKHLTVWGRAKRVRIDFTSHGVPTGKYYFQTQIAVGDATQIAFHE